jgi:hypothetical protein
VALGTSGMCQKQTLARVYRPTRGETLVGRLAEPSHCIGVDMWHAQAALVHGAKVYLAVGAALVRPTPNFTTSMI